MKAGTPQLIKFKKLHRRLGMTRVRDTVGLLESLWHLAARETPRGDIGSLDDETIAIELEWDNAPDHLVETLVETCWLDRHETHRLLVHDWSDHAPRYVHGVAAKKGGIITSPTTVADYSPELQSATVDGVDAKEIDNSRQLAGARLTNTYSSQALPNQENSQADAASSRSSPSGKGKTRPKPARFDPLAIDLPFASEEFRQAWRDWVAHRLELKKPLTETSTKKLLKKIEGMGESLAILAIEHTVAHGWTGLREPEQPRAGPGNGSFLEAKPEYALLTEEDLQRHEYRSTERARETGERPWDVGALAKKP